MILFWGEGQRCTLIEEGEREKREERGGVAGDFDTDRFLESNHNEIFMACIPCQIIS